jgi:hypothetical protein
MVVHELGELLVVDEKAIGCPQLLQHLPIFEYSNTFFDIHAPFSWLAYFTRVQVQGAEVVFSGAALERKQWR